MRGYAGSPDYWGHSGGGYRVSAAEDMPALSHGNASAGAAVVQVAGGGTSLWGFRYSAGDGEGVPLVIQGGC